MIFIIALILVILDQFSKFLVIHKLGFGESIPIIPNIFRITPISNTGIAFGLFKGNNIILIFTSVIVIILLFVFWKRIVLDRSFSARLAIGLIFGGALGNLIDRVRLGCVIDFLDFRIWPIFNFADSGVTIGALLLLLSLIHGGRKRNGY